MTDSTQTREAPSSSQPLSAALMLKKLRGGTLLVVGFMLSPLSWWNDLVFNLPVAYLFGYLCSRFAPELLWPCTIAGYWFSNILGILLMQAGALDLVREQPQERNFKKELITGVVSSTIYTCLILGLVQLKILGTPDLFSEANRLGLSALFPWLNFSS